MKIKLITICLLLGFISFSLSSCGSTASSVTKKTGAVIGLPFAFLGDSLLLPFQCVGHISQGLLYTGGAYDLRYSEQWYWTEYPNEGFGFIFSIPGYILSPFIPLAKLKFYGMTDVCVNTFSQKNIPYRRRRTYY